MLVKSAHTWQANKMVQKCYDGVNLRHNCSIWGIVLNQFWNSGKALTRRWHWCWGLKCSTIHDRSKLWSHRKLKCKKYKKILIILCLNYSANLIKQFSVSTRLENLTAPIEMFNPSADQGVHCRHMLISL